MPSFNKVILAGNLTRDPEMRYTPKGTAIAVFGLAINRHWTNDAGEKMEDVCFVDCKCFGKSAENLAQYTSNGHPLLIEGRLDLEEWEDKQTHKKRSKLAVLVESFQFLKGKSSDDSPKPAKAGKPAKAKTDDQGDDVPF